MSDIALITGAGGKVGAEVARRLADSGMRLALTTRSQDKMPLKDFPGAFVHHGDLSSQETAEELFRNIESHYGESPSCLAHCAGSVMIRPLHRTTPEQYRQCLKNNLDSAFFTLRGFIGALLKSKRGGSAVLVSTVAARIGVNNHEAVAAAKSGVEGLLRSAAATYADKGIRVNGIAPGLLRTAATEGFFTGGKAEDQLAAQYPLGRYGQAEDAAGLICWLLSEDAAWVTGQIIAIDGGFSSIRPQIRI